MHKLDNTRCQKLLENNRVYFALELQPFLIVLVDFVGYVQGIENRQPTDSWYRFGHMAKFTLFWSIYDAI